MFAEDADQSEENSQVDFHIISGNSKGHFMISSSTGNVIIMKPLDREEVDRYTLTVLAQDQGHPPNNSTATLVINVSDANDNAPMFNQSTYEAEVPEMSPKGTTVIRLQATDTDLGGNGTIRHYITAGNIGDSFNINSISGVISVNSKLDHEIRAEYWLVLKAVDAGDNPLSAICMVHIKVLDVNEFPPLFPYKYIEFVPEDLEVGSLVFTAHALDNDTGEFGKLVYSIQGGGDANRFIIDSKTGEVTTTYKFDFEVQNVFRFKITAVDPGGKNVTADAVVNVLNVDEYAPVFTEPEYKFEVPGNAKIGDVVGQVQATDLDSGVHGIIRYQLGAPNHYFSVGPTTGLITVKNTFDHAFSRRKRDLEDGVISLFIQATTGLPNSKFAEAVVRIFIDFSCPGCSLGYLKAANVGDESGVSPLVIGLVCGFAVLILILIIVAVLVFRVHRSKKKSNYPDSSPSYSIPATLPDFNQLSVAPPNLSTSQSEVSEHSQSSGHGSADDMDDDEVRMISSIMQNRADQQQHREEDTISEVSAHNTQEYLARLGIDSSRLPNGPQPNHAYSESESVSGQSVDVQDMCYLQLNDIDCANNVPSSRESSNTFGQSDDSGHFTVPGSLSSIVHSEEELTGSYNWDYLLNWGPQFQPLAHVFAEIARLKDENQNGKKSPAVKLVKQPVETTPRNALLTSLTPKTVSAVGQMNNGQQRSPIDHDEGFTSTAMSPNFQPCLSPLATRSPSVSPMVRPKHNLAVPVCIPKDGGQTSEAEVEI